MPITSPCVDSKIVGHREQPRFGVIERVVLAEVPEESQEGLLCDVLRLSGIPRFSQDVSKYWDAKLFEQGKHSVTQRHGIRSPVRSQREHPFGEYSIRRFAHVEHAYTRNARRGCFRAWGEIFFFSLIWARGAVGRHTEFPRVLVREWPPPILDRWRRRGHSAGDRVSRRSCSKPASDAASTTL